MKKSIGIFLMLPLFLMLVTTCKKSYPEDTPKWIADRIKHCRKTKDCCWENYGLRISEFRNIHTGQIIYKFEEPRNWAPHMFDYYDADGNFLCEKYAAGLVPGYDACGAISICDFTYVREIWSEDPAKCR